MLESGGCLGQGLYAACPGCTADVACRCGTLAGSCCQRCDGLRATKHLTYSTGDYLQCCLHRKSTTHAVLPVPAAPHLKQTGASAHRDTEKRSSTLDGLAIAVCSHRNLPTCPAANPTL